MIQRGARTAHDPVQNQAGATPAQSGVGPVTVGRVALATFGDVDARAMTEALRMAGVEVDSGKPGAEPPELLLALADDYLHPELEAVNRDALESGHPWMLAKPRGLMLWLGPIFRPGETGCWACLAQRVRHNRPVESFLLDRRGAADPLPISRAGLPSTAALAHQMIAAQVDGWLDGSRASELDGAVLTVDLLAGESRRHILARRPQCPDCGCLRQDPGRLPEPVRLQSTPKRFTADGGHRSITPEETLQRFGHHVSPITGPVSVLERSAVDDDWQMHVYVAGHNFAAGQQSVLLLQQGLRVKSSGKGMTDAQARASALGEALERYSSIFHGDEPRMTASYRALGDAAIHPNACMGFSERQLGAERVWGASAADVVPQPLDEDARIEWSPVWSLTRGEHRYLPTSYLYFSYPIRPEAFYAWADSNGNAAGNTLEEAILQGFMELVERDAVAIWWYNRLRRPGVDLASFDEPYLLDLHDRYAGLHRELWLLDLTSDLGIPTFGAFSRRIDKPAEDIIFGFGAHLDPKIAALRAVTEMNQFLPAVLPIQADGSGDYAMYDPNCRRWWQTATVENQPYLAPDPLAPVTSARAIPRAWTADVAEDVRLCQRLVEARGLEMLVLDQTRPDIGLPVAKVIVPGLRHFWPRLGPGRLYDVPVEMGWRERPLTEDELNPLAMFL